MLCDVRLERSVKQTAKVKDWIKINTLFIIVKMWNENNKELLLQRSNYKAMENNVLAI